MLRYSILRRLSLESSAEGYLSATFPPVDSSKGWMNKNLYLFFPSAITRFSLSPPLLLVPARRRIRIFRIVDEHDLGGLLGGAPAIRENHNDPLRPACVCHTVDDSLRGTEKGARRALDDL